MNWIKSLFSGRKSESIAEGDQRTLWYLCQNVSLYELGSFRSALARQLHSLPVVPSEELNDLWRDRGPIVTKYGAWMTAWSAIRKVRMTARIIRMFVRNLDSLDVSIEISRGRLCIILARHFRSGNTDLILHYIARTGKNKFQFAYLPNRPWSADWR